MFNELIIIGYGCDCETNIQINRPGIEIAYRLIRDDFSLDCPLEAMKRAESSKIRKIVIKIYKRDSLTLTIKTRLTFDLLRTNVIYCHTKIQ